MSGIWIRSQDKETLIQTECINFETQWDDAKGYSAYNAITGETVSETEYLLGEYATRERALAVLDEMQKMICYIRRTELYAAQINMSDEDMKQFAYIMPAE